MYERTIICLANSRKPPSGRCIAGKEYEGARQGLWIRPVSARPGHEVSEDERRYEDGIKAQLLDIVSIPLVQHSPLGHQVENHVLDREYYWTKLGTATWGQICNVTDTFDAGFWQNSESTYHGQNDKISENIVAGLQSSLKLIDLQRVELVVHLEDGYQGTPGRRRVRARFLYEGTWYLLSVTDPKIEEQYLTQGNGTYVLEDVILCISLAEVWHEYAFRLVASVITQDRFEVES